MRQGCRVTGGFALRIGSLIRRGVRAKRDTTGTATGNTAPFDPA